MLALPIMFLKVEVCDARGDAIYPKVGYIKFSPANCIFTNFLTLTKKCYELYTGKQQVR